MRSSATFNMEAGPLGAIALRVVGFRGREAVSRTYRWDVTVDVEDVDPDAVEMLLLAQPAVLSILLHDAAPRAVHGVIAAVRHVDASPDGLRVRLRIRLVPRLWLLSRNRVSRIFQEMTAPEIVGEVLREAGIPFETRLVQPCPHRAYCVQYEESDLAFVSRLLAEEGIFYFFRHPPTSLGDPGVASTLAARAGLPTPPLGEMLVLADQAAAYPAIRSRGASLEEAVLQTLAPPVPTRAPSLYLHDGEGTFADDHHVARFTRERAVRPQSVLIRDYDFRRPAMDLTAAQSVSPLAGAAADVAARWSHPDALRRTIMNVTRGGALPTMPPLDAVDPTRMTVYEHHGEDDNPEISRAEALVRLEQLRRGAVTARGASWCRRFEVGHRFCLENHPDGSLNAQYVVSEVMHTGRTRSENDPAEKAAYENTFTCAPAVVPLRPARPTRVHRQVLETARVVGVPGEEIHTDAHGRIKVQFHWDLEGRNDERSSCWMRVAQSWGGASWGTQFIPRVGMEVLVSFLGGDQDRPVVLGCLYNGENTPAFALPDSKTRSGIRTHSSPGGGGYNELSFEDAAGAEQVFLHAQRDLLAEVGRDRTTHVAGDDRERVHGDARAEVRGNRQEVVGQHANLDVAGSLTDFARGPRVLGTSDDLSARAEGAMQLLAGGVASVEGGTLLRLTGGFAGDPGSVEIAAKDACVTRARSVEIEARETFTLRVGNSAICVLPDSIEITSDRILLRATGEIATTSDTIKVDALSSAAVTSKSVSLSGYASDLILDEKAATLRGPSVSLLHRGKAETEEAARQGLPTRALNVRMLDPMLQPYANMSYDLFADEALFQGTTGGDGAVKQAVLATTKRVRVVLWTQGRGVGVPRRYSYRLVDELPAASTREGVVARLRQLGYLTARGAASDEALDSAVRWFQSDHDAEPTGAYSDLSSVIVEVYGS